MRSGLESVVSSILFILLAVSLGALGRDIFFNHLASPSASLDDPVAKLLPYVRVSLCAAAVLLLVACAGLDWAAARVPWLFAPFCLLALASVLWTADPLAGLRDAFVLNAAWIALPLVIHRLGLAATVRLTVHLLAAVCILSAALAIFAPAIGQHTGLEFIQTGHAGRWRGIFSHKNGLGPWAAYGAVFLFTHSRLAGGPLIYWWLARISALACLSLCGSVTALALFGVVGLGAVFARMLRHVSPAVVMATGLAMMLLAALALALLQPVIFEWVGRDPTLSGRLEIWAVAQSYVAAAPWLGHGYQSLGGPEFLARLHAIFDQPIPGPESGYWAMALDLGVVGFVAFFTPYIAAWRNGLEWLAHLEGDNRRALEFLLIVSAGTLVLAISETNALAPNGPDGVLAFIALFGVLAMPKSPRAVRRGVFHATRYWLPAGGPASK